MKEVIKVSIARVSFTLDKDAHSALEQYIAELKEHYRNESGSSEIIDDIEERIMELLVERGLRERVVTLEDINSIITVLGHPKDIDADSGYIGKGYGQSAKNEPKKGKKLYRDINNKVIAGVCSGLGAYLKIDAVFVRIIFLVLAFFAPVLEGLMRIFLIRPNIHYSDETLGFMLIVYIILWIITPPARTVEQRCAMYGESVGIDDIQKKVQVGAKQIGREMRDRDNDFFRVLGRIILVCIGIFMLFMGFAGLITGMLLAVGLEVFENITALEMIDYIELGISNLLLFKALAILVWSLPCIGFIYAGVVLCFGIKSPKWRPGLILFILWLVSLLALSLYSVKAMTPYYNIEKESVITDLPANYDTLYINMKEFEKMDECKATIDKSENYLKQVYVRTNADKKSEVIIYPTIKIRRFAAEDSTQSYIDFRYNTSSGKALIGGVKISDLNNAFNIKDSLITVNYKIVNQKQKFTGENEALYIYLPDRTIIKWVDEEGNECNYLKTDTYRK